MTKVKFITEDKMLRDAYLYENIFLQTKRIEELHRVGKERIELR